MLNDNQLQEMADLYSMGDNLSAEQIREKLFDLLRNTADPLGERIKADIRITLGLSKI
jgi:hypothetical protein